MARPVRASRSSQFDAAIAGLEAISGTGTAYYIANHKRRCVDDALRLGHMVPAGGRILNVGGRPYLIEYIARELGLDMVTLDIDPARNPAERADLGLEVIAADIETAEGRAKADLGRYDIVCLAEIFEHMRIDLLATFRHLAFAMRPDAGLYLTTPNFHYAPRLLARWLSGRSDRFGEELVFVLVPAGVPGSGR